MGVSYKCSGCAKVFHLQPRSPGFGQMRVPCPSCGAQASYAPAISYAAVEATAEHGSVEADAIQLKNALSVGGEEGPSPTVPLQAPDELLALDAMETARTVPVTGLTDEQLRDLDAKMKGRAPARAQAAPAATLRMEAPPMLAATPTPELEGTVRQPGLSDEIFHRATANLPVAARTPEPEPAPTPARNDWMIKSGEEESFDIDEDRIPTRSVEGLADRSVRVYAGDLYNQEAPLTDISDDEVDPAEARAKAEARAREVVARAQAELRQSFVNAPTVQPAPAVKPDPAPAPTIKPTPALRAEVTTPEAPNPTFAMGSPLELRRDEGFSFSDTARTSREPAISGDGPSAMRGDGERARPRAAATLQRPLEASAPPRSGLRGTGAGVMALGVVFVLVFFSILGGLYLLYTLTQEPPPPAPEAPAPAAPTGPRFARFGLPPLDEKSPFKVTRAEVIKDKAADKLVSLRVEGEVDYQGDNALDLAEISGVVGIWSQGAPQRWPLAGPGVEPPIGRKQVWKPRKPQRFKLEGALLPAALLEGDAERFVWISIKAANGKVYQYDAPVHVVDF